MTHPLRVTKSLQDIISACNRVRLYAEGKTEELFRSDLLTHDAIMRALHVIGEASVRIRTEDPAFIEEHGVEPFTRAIGLRNRLAHEYEDIDLHLAWKTVTIAVPALREKVIELLYELGHRPDVDSLHF